MNESHSLKFFLGIWLTRPPCFCRTFLKQPILALNSTITSTGQGKIPDSQPCPYPCETYKCGSKLTSGANVTQSLVLARLPRPASRERRTREQHFLSPLDGAATALRSPTETDPPLCPFTPRSKIQRPKRRRLKHLARKKNDSRKKISGRLSSTSRIKKLWQVEGLIKKNKKRQTYLF